MDHNNHNTTLRTNKHLNKEERFYMEKRLAEGDSKTAIARALGRSRTTIYAEIERGTTEQIKQGKPCEMYMADLGQTTYEANRRGSANAFKVGHVEPFLNWVEQQVIEKHWSLDVAVGYAIRMHLFEREDMVCTKTLYNYVHLDLLSLKPIDLPLMVSRSTCRPKTRKHKKTLGKSIELRDESIETREEFGHWEGDTVRGIKSKEDNVLVTIVERKSRLYVALRCPSATASDVKATLQSWLHNLVTSVGLQPLCKTITVDNGLEFASISDLEVEEQVSIYFAHPYTACERGTNERHNGLLRRFIPKGTPIKDVPEGTLKRALHCINNLPRKILGYKTPIEVFIEEVRTLVDLESVQFPIAI